jgi:hypothetical protein
MICNPTISQGIPDDLLSYEEVSEQYGLKASTWKSYTYSGYVMAVNNKIPRYEAERYVAERRNQGPQPVVDWDIVRKKVIDIALAFSGNKKGWYYNKGAYVLSAARIVGHSPIWISKVLKAPLREVKEICARLHNNGVWKGLYSSHTRWGDFLDKEVLDSKTTDVILGFTLDALTAEGDVVRKETNHRTCMRCGKHNPANSWMCQPCTKPMTEQVNVIVSGPSLEYSQPITFLRFEDLQVAWPYPCSSNEVSFGLSKWNGKHQNPKTGKHKSFNEISRLPYQMDHLFIDGQEGASPSIKPIMK